MTCKAKDFDRICQFCIYCLRNAVFLPFLSSYNNDQRLFKICVIFTWTMKFVSNWITIWLHIKTPSLVITLSLLFTVQNFLLVSRVNVVSNYACWTGLSRVKDEKNLLLLLLLFLKSKNCQVNVLSLSL